MSSEIQDELKYFNNAIASAIQGFNKAMDKLEKKGEGSQKTLEEAIDKIKEESFMLNRLPRDISNQLSAAVPQIAEEVGKAIPENFTQEFEESFSECNNKLVQLSQKVNAITNEVNALNQSKFKSFLINLGMIIIVSGISTFCSTYIIYKRIPDKFVILRAEKDIKIDNSTITIRHQKDEVLGNNVKRSR